MPRARDALLMVNAQYIASASQEEAYRTEPPFELRGSYRNMNKLAEKIVAVMNDDEVQRLIDDHYHGESQTLTTGAEQNLLKSIRSSRRRASRGTRRTRTLNDALRNYLFARAPRERNTCRRDTVRVAAHKFGTWSRGNNSVRYDVAAWIGVSIRTVDLRDGRERVGPVLGHAAPWVMSAEIISAGETPRTVTVLDTRTLAPTAHFEVGGVVTALTADAQTIVAGVLDPAALVVVPRDGSPPRRVPLPDVPRIAALSPDGRFVSVGVGTEKSGGNIFVIEIATGQLRATLKGLRALPTSLFMTATDVLACGAKTVLAWPVCGGKSHVLLKGAKHFALLLGVTPGGLAIVGSYQQTIMGVDPTTGDVRWTRDAYGPSALHAARLVSCHFRALNELDPETGVAHATVAPPDAVGMLALDATRTCTTAIVDSGVVVLPAGATVWPRRRPCAHGSPVTAVSFDGDRFATGGSDGRNFVWRRGEAQPLASFDYEGGGSSETLACLLEGDTLITAHGHRLQRWSVTTGETLAVSPPLPWSARLIVPLPDLGRLFVATDPWRGAITHFVLLDPLTLEIAHDARQKGNYDAYAHARRVGPNLIRLTNSMVWADVQLPSCRIVANGWFRGYGNVVDAHHLTGDEVHLVRVDNLGPTVAERRGRMVVYRASDGTALHELDTQVISSAAMRPDGRFATLHHDGVRLWDVAAGQMIAEVTGSGKGGAQLTWFPDGQAPLRMNEHANENHGDAEVARIEAIAAEVGFDVRHLAPFILERMRLLASSSETVSDGTRMADFARKAFARYDASNPDRPWTAIERRTVVLGSLFSDIGKTGPLHATEEGQRLVTEMFAVERVDDETQSVETFLRTYFPRDAARRIAIFGALGLDASMSLRAFWNLHAGFTLDILEAGGVPKEAVAAAATHHFLDDVNPDGVVCADGRFSRPYGENEGFDRAEKLVIVLDKYDAVRRRGACAHDDAIAWLRRWVERREAFRDDVELFGLIDVVDAALRED